MTDTTVSLLNHHLQRYQIKEKIGTGGMARVYRGVDTNLEREVAIKVLHEHLAEDVMFKDRFEREARFVAGITHPNIVQIFDYSVIQRDDYPLYYMVMSYIPGQTLRECLQICTESESPLPRERVLEIMLNLTSALSYAHAKGLIHRDVKPANIILHTETGQAHLTDFGIARMMQGSNLTQEGSAIGTPAYMSPEQATGDVLDGRSDLYALGIILYEMLAGQPPFGDDGSLSVLIKHLNEPIPTLSKVIGMDEPFMDAVIYKALAKLPEDRYQTAEEFAQDLQMAFTGQQPGAVTTHTRNFAAIPKGFPTGQHATTVPKSNYRAIAFPVIIVLLVVMAVAFSVLSSQNQTATAEPIYFSTSFNLQDELTNSWPQGEVMNVSRSIDTRGYIITNTQFRTAIPTIFTQGEYTNTVIQLRGSLTEESTSASAYGIIFRYVDERNYYVFAVDGVGRYSLWVRLEGDWIELRDPDAIGDDRWTQNQGIRPIGGSNILQVVVYDDEISGYVNGVPVVTLKDDTIASGRVGIYVASTEQANTTAIIDMFAVSEAPSSMTAAESMTGGDSFARPEDG